MKKKGQITIFIIFGVVILLIVYLAITLNDSIVETTSEGNSFQATLDSENILFNVYIESCLADVADEAIEHVSANGGQSRLKAITLYDDPAFPLGRSYPLTLRFGADDVPIFYTHNNVTGESYDLSPDEEQLALQIADKISSAMPYCLNNFKPFLDRGFKIAIGGSRTDVVFESDVDLRIKYFLDATIESESRVTLAKEVTYEVQSHILFFTKVNQILISEISNYAPNGFPDFTLAQLANAYEFRFIKQQYKDSTIVVKLFKDSITGKRAGGDLSAFMSAYEFDWNLNPYKGETALLPVTEVSTWQLPGYIVPYDSFDPPLYTWDISSNFDSKYDYFNIYSETFKIIPDTGVIRASPIYPKIGENEIVVKAFTLHDLNDYQLKKFIINVTDPLHDLPFVQIFDHTVAYRGFPYYQRIWAMGSQDKVVFYEMELPEALRNMPCGGYLAINGITGEIEGQVTAPVGNYPFEVKVSQFINSTHAATRNFLSVFQVTGNYSLATC
jgi:hypothetical protein